ncbi:MAG TPA: type II toxin-antitoxin system VapC family toxin [Thermoanaerobaculia bacterium]|jgi:tRNA(fMet)-specific endonuclease VapC|nr:type II toxin-antitoxin system VapC family toxin [Thermoanaerobaculia bacterium]
MSYLFDTCVISEFVAKQPSEKIVAWLAGLNPESVFLSVVTIGEIQKGIARLRASKRKEALQRWLKDDLLVRFHDRLLPLGVGEMLTWGTLMGEVEAKGKPMPLIDSLIAATAVHHDLVVVTRDEDDFAASGVRLLNPWN